MSERPIEKSVREICLLCRGERWLPEILHPERSRPCPYCEGQGWVLISPASLGEDEAPSKKKESA